MGDWRSWVTTILIVVVVPFGWLYPLVRGVRRTFGTTRKPAFQPIFLRRRRP